MRRILIIAVVVVAGAAAALSAVLSSGGSGYRVSVLLASADNMVTGGWVTMNGFQVGQVDSISVKDGKALVGLSLDDADAPLHDGAKVTVEWQALLGARLVEIHDGAKSNAVIPSGGMIAGTQSAPVNMDQVLNALDPATRAHLASLLTELDATVHGHETDANATLLTAGPALRSLGQVLTGLGTDGPAIHDLVVQLNSMVGTLSARDSDVRAIVDNLTRTVNATVSQRQALDATLRELPSTLDTATHTLGDVPGVADKAVPLLKDVQPATARLPEVSGNLAPVLRTLGPVVDQLAPTLTSAQALLRYTPGLLGAAQNTVPGLTTAAGYLQPVLNYLRPYTPELAGWLSAWAGNGSNYDGNGHFVRFYLQEGATTFGNNPGIVPPGAVYDPYPAPGANGGQPWTDAWGSGVR
jgi:phospholipid/cholesterol/gamma-HCH transport system substrate-binding protein